MCCPNNLFSPCLSTASSVGIEGASRQYSSQPFRRKETRRLSVPSAFDGVKQLSRPLENCSLEQKPAFVGLSPLKRVSSPGLSSLKYLGLRCSKCVFPVSPLSKHLPIAEFFSCNQHSKISPSTECSGAVSTRVYQVSIAACLSPGLGRSPHVKISCQRMSALMEAPVFNLERAISFFLLHSSFPVRSNTRKSRWFLAVPQPYICTTIVEEKLVLFLGSFQLFLTLCSCAVASLQFNFLIFRPNPGAWRKVLVIFIL